eukprot:scaffold3400_cov103-Phaeocystis_antarctica.AAC.1
MISVTSCAYHLKQQQSIFAVTVNTDHFEILVAGYYKFCNKLLRMLPPERLEYLDGRSMEEIISSLFPGRYAIPKCCHRPNGVRHLPRVEVSV